VQSSSQIITTNKPTTSIFFTGWMPFLSPNQQCQSTEWKISHSMDLLTRSSPGIFQLCLWPLIAPGYLGEDCHQPSDASTPNYTSVVYKYFSIRFLSMGFLENGHQTSVVSFLRQCPLAVFGTVGLQDMLLDAQLPNSADGAMFRTPQQQFSTKLRFLHLASQNYKIYIRASCDLMKIQSWPNVDV